MAVAVAYALSLVTTIGSIAGGVGLFAARLERGEGFARRMALLAGAALVGCLVATALGAGATGPDPGAAVPFALQMLLFSSLVPCLVAVVMWLFGTSVWTALFCCTAGYAVQNLASSLTELACIALGSGGGRDVTVEGHLVRCAVNVACVCAVYVPFYLAFARRVSREGLERVRDRGLLAVMVVVMLGVIGFDLLIKQLTTSGLDLADVVALRGCHAMTCALTIALAYELLVSRHLREERAVAERLLEERERQYERSRENIDAINIKCHDIRHQIRSLAAGGVAVEPAVLDDIAREVDVYDAAVRTGNDALDTILTEKSLACRAAGVALTCIADGHALDFMAPADIYALFGNALDNALRATAAAGEAAPRTISLVVRRAAGVVSIHVENPYAGELRLDASGALRTTKNDPANHGLGVRSMRLTVERYGGTLTTLAEGGTFHVNAIVPHA